MSSVLEGIGLNTALSPLPFGYTFSRSEGAKQASFAGQNDDGLACETFRRSTKNYLIRTFRGIASQ